MIAAVEEVTDFVATAKVTLLLPATSVTLAGTVADELLLDSVTVTLVGAGALKVTVPVDEAPPVTVVGFSETDDNATAGLMVRDAVLFTPL